jgi:hypothetical protein
MLVEYKKKWFNPELVESIKVYLSGNTVIHDNIYKRQLYISIYVSGNSQITIPIEIYCDNNMIEKCRNPEYMDELAKSDLNKLASFINKHCKETKCKS